MTLGNKLQKLRKDKRMSQEKLAEELGVTRQAVSKWELDSALPDIVNVVALSELFGVTTDYLLKDDVQTDAPPDNKHKSRNSSRKRTAGVICIAAGVVSIFITYLISRFVRVMIPIKVYHDGQWQIHWNPEHVDISYIYFIKEYKLQLLLVLFGLVLLAGMVLVFWDKYICRLIKRITAEGRKWFD